MSSCVPYLYFFWCIGLRHREGYSSILAFPGYPADTWRLYNVTSTSMQRLTQRSPDVYTTSPQRRCNVLPSGHMTFIQRRLNVDATSKRCIDVEATLAPSLIFIFTATGIKCCMSAVKMSPPFFHHSAVHFFLFLLSLEEPILISWKIEFCSSWYWGSLFGRMQPYKLYNCHTTILNENVIPIFVLSWLQSFQEQPLYRLFYITNGIYGKNQWPWLHFVQAGGDLGCLHRAPSDP